VGASKNAVSVLTGALGVDVTLGRRRSREGRRALCSGPFGLHSRPDPAIPLVRAWTVRHAEHVLAMQRTAGYTPVEQRKRGVSIVFRWGP